MSDLPFLTIAEASQLIAARKLSPVELTEAYLVRIAALDHLLDSFVTLTAERARAEAKAAEAAIMAGGPRSRMHGIPYCLKDIYDTAGIRTTAMSKLLADNVPTRDAVLPGEARGSRRRAAGQERHMGVRPWRAIVGRAVPAGAQPVEPRIIRRPVRPPDRPPRSPRGSRRQPWAATPAGRSAVRPRRAASPD